MSDEMNLDRHVHDSTPRPQQTSPDGKAGFFDHVRACSLGLLAASLTYFAASGHYRSFVTPRAIPYVWFAVAVISAFAVAAWLGWFRCGARSLARTLVVAMIPALLFALPIDTAAAQGLDGTNRAIEIRTSPTAHLTGLDAARHTITISDDDFGSWFERIDRDPVRYAGYTVVVAGSVSRDSSLGTHQFRVSRMLMTCCVLDMTPFGFVVDMPGDRDGNAIKQNDMNAKSAQAMPSGSAAVTVRGTLRRGRIGNGSASYDGLVLDAARVTASHDSFSGYFYR